MQDPGPRTNTFFNAIRMTLEWPICLEHLIALKANAHACILLEIHTPWAQAPAHGREATDREATGREATGREATDREATDREATDREVTDREATNPSNSWGPSPVV